MRMDPAQIPQTLMEPAMNQISTEAGHSAALAMFSEIPCIMQLTDAGCEEQAKWVTYFTHEEDRGECTADPAPVCNTHKTAIQRASIPFWRVWFSMQPVPCDRCGAALRLDRFEALT